MYISGMLHGGQSLRVFTKWCSDEKNLIIMPGFCVANTVGARVISGAKKIEIAGRMVKSFIYFDLQFSPFYNILKLFIILIIIVKYARHIQVSFQRDINLGVEYMSFSAHADAKGIMQVNLKIFFFFVLLVSSKGIIFFSALMKRSLILAYS